MLCNENWRWMRLVVCMASLMVVVRSSSSSSGHVGDGTTRKSTTGFLPYDTPALRRVLHEESTITNVTDTTLVKFEFSCEDSSYHGIMKTCEMVSWRTARVTRQFVREDTLEVLDSKELDTDDMLAIVVTMTSDEMLGHLDWLKWNASTGGSCGRNRERVACGYMFRRCRHGRPEMVPENMCFSVCSEYRESCLGETASTVNKTSVPVCDNVFPNEAAAVQNDWDCANNTVLLETEECTSFQREDDCFLVPHHGYFLLDIELGPYEPLVDIYAALLIAWGVLLVAWLVIVFVAPLCFASTEDGQDSSTNALLRTLTVLPLIKVAYVGISFSFWSTCVAWGECSYWINVGRSNFMLIFETALFLCLILIGKGWLISRATISQFELRRTVLIVCLFYLGDSLLLVLQSYVKWFYWVLLTLIYFGLMLFVMKSVNKSALKYRRALLQLEIGSDTFNAVFVKFLFFLRYRFVLVLFTVGAILSHGLLSSIRNRAIWPFYVLLELVEITLFVSLIALLWPHKEHSLFSETGASALFNEDGFTRLAPMITADVTISDSNGVDDVLTRKRVDDENTSDDVSCTIDDKRRSNSTTSLMSASAGSRVSPMSGDRKKRNAKTRGFLWGGKKKSKRSNVAPIVVMIRNPGDDGRLAIGVQSDFSSVFSRGVNSRRPSEDEQPR